MKNGKGRRHTHTHTKIESKTEKSKIMVEKSPLTLHTNVQQKNVAFFSPGNAYSMLLLLLLDGVCSILYVSINIYKFNNSILFNGKLPLSNVRTPSVRNGKGAGDRVRERERVEHRKAMHKKDEVGVGGMKRKRGTT